MILIPVSAGELIDRITILSIKRQRIMDPDKHRRVCEQLALLERALDQLAPPAQSDTWVAALRKTNEALWDVEDELRECERAGRFDARFVALARAVYRNNDRRNAIKRKLDQLLRSELSEAKSYTSY